MSRSELEERLENALSTPKNGDTFACDMHVHSSHSNDVAAHEDYSPLTNMMLALERGMHYFTLTDHNTYTGVLELQDQLSQLGKAGAEGLKRFFSGVEVDCHVERLGQGIHMNIFDLSESQWRDIRKLYKGGTGDSGGHVEDFDALTDYLDDEGLIYSYNHPFFREDDFTSFWRFLFKKKSPMDMDAIAEVAERFPLIEVNSAFVKRANDLTERIASYKGIPVVGGSDDHFSLGVGRGSVAAPGDDSSSFLQEVVAGNGRASRIDLTYDHALEEAEHVVDLFLGGKSDDWEAMAKLTNKTATALGRVYTKLWLPRTVKNKVESFVARAGAKKLIAAQNSALPEES